MRLRLQRRRTRWSRAHELDVSARGRFCRAGRADGRSRCVWRIPQEGSLARYLGLFRDGGLIRPILMLLDRYRSSAPTRSTHVRVATTSSSARTQPFLRERSTIEWEGYEKAKNARCDEASREPGPVPFADARCPKAMQRHGDLVLPFQEVKAFQARSHAPTLLPQWQVLRKPSVVHNLRLPSTFRKFLFLVAV